ncbi:MAG: alkaline phosphatase [Clostridia bacterium]|nr:alkaline phosphatase [Clostridia bacterium]
MKKKNILKALSALLLAALMLFTVSCADTSVDKPTEAPKDTEAPTAEAPTEAPVTPMEEILAALGSLEFGEIKNVILYIGDGMGMNHVPATDAITGGRYDGKLAFEYLPVFGTVDVLCTEGEPDSASGGTALATGYKSKRKFIAQNSKGEDVKTVVELAKELGKSAGVITSESIVDATPATFSVHAPNRNDESVIAGLQIETSVADFIMGGGKAMYDKLFDEHPEYKDKLAENNVTYVTSWEDVLSFDGSGRLIATMTDDYWEVDAEMTPTLAEMTEQSIKMLSGNDKGFFLMVEGGAMDEIAHNADIMELTRHMVAFDKAIEVGLRYAYENKDTVIIVTADHNTGGLLPKEEADSYIAKNEKTSPYIAQEEWCLTNAKLHCLYEAEKIAQEKNPDVDWNTLPYRFTTIAHTSDKVNVWAVGPGTESLTEAKLKCFQIGKLIGNLLGGEDFGSADKNGVK